MSKFIPSRKTVGIIAATHAVELAVAVIFIQIGAYNVSVLSPDPRLIQWVFNTTSSNSIEHHAKGITVPTLTDSSTIADGFANYNAMCVTCHGAPGVDPSEAGQGLFPQPPDLAESAKELSPGALFWVIKNGIKSTGMPSFAKAHSDQKIWGMVAFIEKMKTMTPDKYAMMQKSAANKEDEGHTAMKNMDMKGMKIPDHDH